METRLQKRKKIEMKKKIKKLKDEPLPGTSKQAEDDLHSPAVKNSDDAVFDIQNLPPELIMKILKYLTLDDLCRAGRASKTWHEMTRSPVFWKRVKANIGGSSIPQVIFHLIKILPSFVTSISLHFDLTGAWYIEFSEFTKQLRERCSNLQHLVLNYASFEIETEDLVLLCTELPINVRVLALPHCNFYLRGHYKESEDPVSHIEVLDISECIWPICSRYSLHRMPNLKKLRIAGWKFFHDNFFESIEYFLDQLEILDLERTQTCNITFHTLFHHSQHLTELYVCWTHVKDSDLVSIKEQKGFPCLKIICLRGCDVTTLGVFSLMKSCPTLKKIIVGSRESVLNDPASLDSEIVEDLGFGYCNHSKKVDYMLE